jgi:hypothetical protein
VREHKLKIEMVAAKKQNEEFRQLVDKGKAIRSIVERKKRKEASASSGEGDDEEGGHDSKLLLSLDGEEENGPKKKENKRVKRETKALLSHSLHEGDGQASSSSSQSDKFNLIKRRFHQHKPLTMDGDGPSLDLKVLKSTLGRSAEAQH